MTPNHDKRPQQLADVARLYYEKELSKTEISHEIRVSITQVTRLLREARQLGLVRIELIPPKIDHLQKILKDIFPVLNEVCVTPSSRDFISARQMCAKAAAGYFEKIINPGMSIALGGGYTIYDMVTSLPERNRNIKIYPSAIIGRGPNILLPDRIVNVALLLSRSGNTTTAYTATVLPYERHIEMKQMRSQSQKFLKASSIVREVYEGMRSVDAIFTTVGPLKGASTYRDIAPHLTLKRLGELGVTEKVLQSQGAVGELSYEFYDEEGNTKPEWKLAISLGVEHAQKMVADKKTVAIIAGKYKEAAVMGALKGKLCNALFTDEDAAENLIQVVQSSPQSIEKPQANP